MPNQRHIVDPSDWIRRSRTALSVGHRNIPDAQPKQNDTVEAAMGNTAGYAGSPLQVTQACEKPPPPRGPVCRHRWVRGWGRPRMPSGVRACGASGGWRQHWSAPRAPFHTTIPSQPQPRGDNDGRGTGGLNFGGFGGAHGPGYMGLAAAARVPIGRSSTRVVTKGPPKPIPEPTASCQTTDILWIPVPETRAVLKKPPRLFLI